MKYCLAWHARQDLLDIWQHIAKDSEPAADRFIDLLTKQFGMLGKNPYLGRRRDDLREGYRSFPVGRYLILYRVLESLGSPETVAILHVVHGARDIEASLRP